MVLGPLPTLGRFIALPLTQTAAFVRTELLPFLLATAPSDADAGKRGKTRVVSGEGGESDEGEEGEEGEGEGDVAAGGEEERRSKSRLEASAIVQFPLLLATTKSLVPLLALVCTGSRLPAFWGALVSGQLLRLVGVLPPELLHLLLVGAGALHTLLGASEHGSGAAAADSLQLQWRPSVRDILSVAVVALLGATAASAQKGGGGSAPLFCCSFAAGIAIRMAFYDILSPSGDTNLVGAALAQFFGMAARGLHAFAGVEIVGSDAVAVRCMHPHGSCGGGVLRSVVAWLAANERRVSWLPPLGERVSWLPPLGDLLAARLWSCAIKAALLALPALAAAQWGLRAAQAMRRARGKGTGTVRVRLRLGVGLG